MCRLEHAAFTWSVRTPAPSPAAPDAGCTVGEIEAMPSDSASGKPVEDVSEGACRIATTCSASALDVDGAAVCVPTQRTVPEHSR